MFEIKIKEINLFGGTWCTSLLPPGRDLRDLRKVHPVKLHEWLCAWLQRRATRALPDHFNRNLWCETGHEVGQVSS